jgi:hypothetical protein
MLKCAGAFLSYAWIEGGPRSVWEEKPGLLNVTATECILNSAAKSKGRADAVGKAAALGGADCKQQFMGHFSEFAVGATIFPASPPFACSVIPWQWCSCAGVAVAASAIGMRWQLAP